MQIFATLLLIAATNAVPKVNAGVVIEQSAIGLVGAVVVGFLAGEIGWVAAPELEGEPFPNRLKLRTAIAASYGLGIPAGAALGVHLSGLVVGRHSAFWPKWAGAEVGALAGDGIGLVILSYTNADTVNYSPYYVDRPLEIVAAALPVVLAIGGSFAGDFVATRLGWADAFTEPPVHLGLNMIEGRPALYCGVRFRF